MKYAIILESNAKYYLIGFTNTPIEYSETIKKRTVELRELRSLFIPLEGDNAIYLS